MLNFPAQLTFIIRTCCVRVMNLVLAPRHSENHGATLTVGLKLQSNPSKRIGYYKYRALSYRSLYVLQLMQISTFSDSHIRRYFPSFFLPPSPPPDFHSCTMHPDTIKVFYLPTNAQQSCFKRILKFTLKQLLRVSVQSPSSGSVLSELAKVIVIKIIS